MNIIKAIKLAYEDKRYGEDRQVEENLRAVDDVDLDVKKVILWQFWVTMDPEKVWDTRQSAGMVFKNPDKLHVAVHEVSMIMSIALCFIPILLEETDKVMKAQEARGYRGGERRTKMKLLIYQKRDRMAYGVMITER